MSLIQLPQVPITVRRVEKYRVTNFKLSQVLNHRARRAKHEREYTVLAIASRTEQYRVKWRRTVMALSKRKPGLDQHRVYRV